MCESICICIECVYSGTQKGQTRTLYPENWVVGGCGLSPGRQIWVSYKCFAIPWSSLTVLHTNDYIIRATVHALRLSSAISLTLQGSFDTQMYAFLFLGYTSSTRITVSWSTCLNSKADFAYQFPNGCLSCALSLAFQLLCCCYHAAYMRVLPNAHIQL